ncbi:hypothetical protein DFJ74DRAFT_773377 [Hyaloraphidium curvatum]|nr:hypothetical protein DFJ74DRAFT_773377 [Hyaloraphidium curvatum]
MSWGSFDEASFVAEVERQLAGGAEAFDALVAAAKAGPTFPAGSNLSKEPAVRAAGAAKPWLERAAGLIGGLVIDEVAENAVHEGDARARIKNPDKPAPLDAFFPRGKAPPGGLAPPDLAQRVVGHLSTAPSPSATGEDTDLVDAIARCMIANGPLVKLLALRKWPSKAPRPDALNAVLQTRDLLGLVLMLVLERPKLWRERFAGVRCGGDPVPAQYAARFALRLSYFMKQKHRRGELGQRSTDLFQLYASLEEAITPGSTSASLREIRGLIIARETVTNVTPGSDWCDGCLKPRGEHRLRRCARCGIARYCGAECQRAAWTEHKKDCTPRGSSVEE